MKRNIRKRKSNTYLDLSLNKNYKVRKLDGTSESNQTTTNRAVDEARNFAESWYSHPTTQSMMEQLDPREKYSDPTVTIKGREVPLDAGRRYNIRTAIKTTPINYVELPKNTEGNYIHDLSDRGEINMNSLYFNPSDYSKEHSSVVLHEIDHAVQQAEPYILETTQPVSHRLKDGVFPNVKLDAPKEVRSKVMQGRQYFKLNPSKRDYTPEEAAILQEKARYSDIQGVKDLDRLAPETLAGYLNYLAENNNESQPVFFGEEDAISAANGGELKVKKFNEGGWKKATTEALKNAGGKNLGSTVGAMGGAAMSIVESSMANAKVDTSSADNAIDAVNSHKLDNSSLDALSASYSTVPWASEDMNFKDFRPSGGELAMNTVKATIQGAGAGAKLGPWGCVCAGTRVLTKEGIFKNIEDLKENDGILGYSDKTAKEETIKLCEGEAFKECVKIELESGNYIECSIDHPIYLSRQHERHHKKINGSDRKYRKYNYVKASECNVGDSVGVIREIPYFGNHHESNAYLIGLLIGDGTYGKNKGGRLHTGDKNTWDYIETNNLGYICEDHTKNSKYSKEFRTYRIHNASKLLSAYGLYGQTKLNKTLPNNIQNWDKESLANLIAGLWDTDGYITVESKSKKHRICFTQSNLPLLKSLQEVLIRFGILSSIKINKSKVSHIKTHEIKSKESYVLIIKDKISTINFYNNIHLNIDYKQQNLNKCFELVNAKYCHDSSYLEGLKADKIVNIIPIGVRRIYNLEAKEYNNYIANFIVTHNSIAGAAVGLGASLGGLFAGRAKAKKEEVRLEKEAQAANNALEARAIANRDTIMQNQMDATMRNIAAEGGQLDFENGKEYELSLKEIKDLKNKGYEFESAHKINDTIDIDPSEIQTMRELGYEFEII